MSNSFGFGGQNAVLAFSRHADWQFAVSDPGMFGCRE